ncbi:tetratricopeptide repeat protein [Geomonas subterranea]|uniref:Tetratricopeptide repeat protein n=2 Tax=Geomonas subterranea TaxID=2847989 RepID=A0ABX8LDX6_9BACT|nr:MULTISPECIES: tetratricopeptide repeat protein [Geomonas]QXE90261.1 tetratricopeptide repeat protein [Geomonas subterranea]QXM11650.1 tetratricopeptide repeat protein [Geomonas subterranea]
MTFTLRIPGPGLFLGLVTILFACALPQSALAQQENRLWRVAVHPHQGFTRVNLFFQSPPDYTLRVLPGRVRLEVRGADSPTFKKLRALNDRELAGVTTSELRGVLSVSIAVREAEPGVQVVSCANPSVLSLDVGPGVKRAVRVDIAPGREPILSGTERFVRDFDADPGGVPFAPTDGKVLKGLLPEGEALLFQQGESLLYRDRAEEAVNVFSMFTNKGAAPKALASFRLGEALERLGRHQEALSYFRQGEALWPQYLEQAPELLQPYSDALARTGDFPAARALLLRLMNRYLGTPYQAELLNRLADLIERNGQKTAALAMYRSVAVYAAGSAAAGRARLKLADRELFTLSRDRYQELLGKYRAVYQEPGDPSSRDEALFKMTLLLSLYASPREALDTVITYDRRYPRGIFSTIVKKMREEILFPVYQDAAAAGKDQELVQLALDNREYLARCFGDPGFAPRISQAFEKSGATAKELELFGYLDQKNWAAGSAPFLLARMVDDAVAIGNVPLAEATARDFLSRFPRDRYAGRVREQLGRLAFERGDLPGAAAQLAFLRAKGGTPQLPDSEYYLGKALEGAKDHAGAVRSLARFTLAAKRDNPLLPDGYFTLATALAAGKDYQRALAACVVGASVASGEMSGQFLYKTGELQLQLGEVRQAKATWEKGAATGGAWGRLASEALSDLNWRMKIAGQLP